MGTNRIIFAPKFLYRELLPVLAIINSNTVLPILECFHVRADKEKRRVTFTATDLENVVAVSVDVDMTESFSFCVDAGVFMKFLKETWDAPTTLKWDESKREIMILQDDLVITIPGEAEVNFPKVPGQPTLKSWTGSALIFLPLLQQAIPFVSNDDLRPAMTGVYMHDAGDNGLRIVATDAHRLYYNSALAKAPEGLAGIEYIIPVKAVRVLCKFGSKKDNLHIYANDNHVQFVSGRMALTSRKIDAKYPDYKMVLVQPETHFYVKRSQLLACLNMGMVFANRSTNQIIFHVCDDEIQLVTGDVDFSMEMKYRFRIYEQNKKSMNFTFAFNARFLKEALLINKRDDLVKISTMEAETKAFNVDDCTMLMPLMLNR
jgi:DNA polymerase-3 subunit beta